VKGPPLPPLRHATIDGALRAVKGSGFAVRFVDARDRESVVGWNDVYARARRAAGALHALGVRPADRVALVIPTSEAFLDAYFGALLAGAVPVPLYPPVRLGRLDEYHAATARMLRAAGARIVVSDAAVRRLLGQAVERARPPLGCHLADDLSKGPPAEELDRVASPDDRALVQFSSGSTVDPKPVCLTHRQLAAQCTALSSLVQPPTDRKPVVTSWLPLYHDMGLIGCVLTAAFYPSDLVLIPPEVFMARPAVWLRAISRHRAFVSPAPNFAYALAVRRVRDTDLKDVDLSCWRFALNGAEPVSMDVMRKFAARFAPFGFDASALMPVYGLAEAALGVAFPPAHRGARSLSVDAAALAISSEVTAGTREIASVGVPVPGFEIEIRDDDGAVLGERRVGRVFAKGPSVMEVYLDDEAATARTLVSGWLDTGDLGFVAEGELYICGRARDLVIIRGKNHAPQEFEDCLAGLAGLRPGCAVAVGFLPEGGSGEELLILVERATGDASLWVDEEALVDEIRSAVLDHTGVLPHTVELLAPGSLPRTSSGKLRRGEALRRYLGGVLLPPTPVRAVGLAAEMVKSAVAFAKVRLTR